MRSDPQIEMDVMWERKEYTSDLTDAEWAIIEPLLAEDKAVGRLREVDLREVFNAINGCDLNSIQLKGDRKPILVELIPELIPTSRC